MGAVNSKDLIPEPVFWQFTLFILHFAICIDPEGSRVRWERIGERIY